MNKIRKNFWEKLFKYPSFGLRFSVILITILFIFSVIIHIFLFKLQIAPTISEQVAVLNLIVQLATLVLGIFAAYYALRQLVETRFTGLDEAATQSLKRNHYSKAIEKWREAFYIKPEASVFTSMCETLLLSQGFNMFDDYMKIPEGVGLVLDKKIFQETSDQITLLYLKIIRHLLVKNQGEAEKYLQLLISLIKEKGLPDLNWEFKDLITSKIYQDLEGECKIISENLVSYLSKTIQPVRKKEFESGKFSSQIIEPKT